MVGLALCSDRAGRGLGALLPVGTGAITRVGDRPDQKTTQPVTDLTAAGAFLGFIAENDPAISAQVSFWVVLWPDRTDTPSGW